MTNLNKTPPMKYSELVNPSCRKTLDVRLLSKSKYNKDTGCLEFTGGRDKYGYGMIKVNERQLGTHRVAYVTFIGDIPAGNVVMHTCDNPSCINTDHLRLGTQKDNIHDAVKKGRMIGANLHNTHNWKGKGDYFRPLCVYNDSISKIYRNISIAVAEGFTEGTLYRVLNGQNKTTGGFKAYYIS